MLRWNGWKKARKFRSSVYEVEKFLLCLHSCDRQCETYVKLPTWMYSRHEWNFFPLSKQFSLHLQPEIKLLQSLPIIKALEETAWLNLFPILSSSRSFVRQTKMSADFFVFYVRTEDEEEQSFPSWCCKKSNPKPSNFNLWIPIETANKFSLLVALSKIKSREKNATKFL